MNRRISFYAIIAVLTCVAYVAGFGFEFFVDPLGRSPVLDGRENLAWASLIAHGQLPDEPLYRALLYPWVLSHFYTDGGVAPLIASLFGLLCHFLNALLVAGLASRLWAKASAAWLSGVLYVLYPVSLYFSVQVLDITFAMTLFLAGLYSLLRGNCLSLAMRRQQYGWYLLAGLLAGFSVLARPNFLLPVVCLPIAPFILGEVAGTWRRVFGAACLLLVAVLLPLLGQGAYNLSKSGEFRVLPWQGGYNLLTANKTGANGKFYKQVVAFDHIPAGMNPNRLESEYLYRGAMGSDAPLEIDAMNHYWREQLLEDVAGDPQRWLGLMCRKALYIVNDWEQYNNLTYAYHKARFELLRYNPLGWGALLIAAMIGCWFFRAQCNGRVLLFLLGLLVVYAAGVLLFYTSARFRLPLVPFLAVFCGGFAWMGHAQLLQMRGRLAVLLAVFLIGMSVFVYGDWFEARDRSSFIQDELLLASATARLMEDAAALEYAQAVLVRDPLRREAQVIQTTSLYNLWLTSESAGKSADYWQQLGASFSVAGEGDATILFIRGVYAWRVGASADAIQLWANAAERYGEAATASIRALQAVGQVQVYAEDDASVLRLKRVLFGANLGE
jgi:4-amino-4-deoxy-L-arabinose transferase-like glycosyltransferase